MTHPSDSPAPQPSTMIGAPGLEIYRNVVVLTGAGISVASGLRPYRGQGGLWEEDDSLQHLITASTLASDPGAVWSRFGPLRDQAIAATPNAAHRALTAWESFVVEQGGTFTLITQNVDGLHHRAGTQHVIELHGSVFITQCSNHDCSLQPYQDHDSHDSGCPQCTKCDAVLRPGVVLFEEPLPAAAEWHSKRALRDCDLFMAIGTSGTVSPAANFVRAAKYSQARTLLVNLEPMRPRHPAYDEEYLGPAEVLLPQMLGFALD
ncbi:MAG: Sir2 family NAD-dependent protein deacetylase [Cyanobacteria bacterium P01_G01_bin.54]